MEISKDAILRMVSAIRMADRMAKAISKFSFGENTADQIAGKLGDVLYEVSGEKKLHENDCEFDYSNSDTFNILRDPTITAKQAAEMICEMAWENRPRVSTEFTPPLNREEFAKSVKENGGYLSQLPEGEWK